MGRGYSGNHPRFSHRQDERYDAKEAYNKDLTASARLHYLENDRHDHESPAHSHCSPMHRHNDRHIRREAKQIARKNEGDEQDIYYELKTQIDDERSRGAAKKGKEIGKFLPKNDERGGMNEMNQEIMQEEVDRMLDERGGIDSPMNSNHFGSGGFIPISQHGRNKIQHQLPEPPFSGRGGGKKPKPNFDKPGDDPKPPMPEPSHSGRGGGVIRRRPDKVIDDRYGSPMNACAKSEGGSGCIKQMGGAWRVISNKTDKPWPAKYASKSKAEAALRGYHAG